MKYHVHIMSVSYARAKFSNAVHYMAVGEGNIKARLHSAFIEIVAVTERDIPAHLQDDYRWVRSELTKKEAKGRAMIEGKLVVGVGGKLGATLKTMRYKRAIEIANRICEISYRLNDMIG